MLFFLSSSEPECDQSKDEKIWHAPADPATGQRDQRDHCGYTNSGAKQPLARSNPIAQSASSEKAQSVQQIDEQERSKAECEGGNNITKIPRLAMEQTQD
ncbi:hypothetical protein N7539_002337 [Penicillium diatomitis]|uniref:Uncharacterized protein n=1 Tax=Penicillium diatomitis TaxID=2819901 RepID=A0A9W9XEG9_9EURO|nr:uncharacterized protein N7539_002337 [Penicillium diatomitis]KAJ5490770.1 hypothetical protein N7539_002337 [Penicillium diatomitis]